MQNVYDRDMDGSNWGWPIDVDSHFCQRLYFQKNVGCHNQLSRTCDEKVSSRGDECNN